MRGFFAALRMTIFIFVAHSLSRFVDEAEDFEGGQAELAARGDGKGLEEVEVFERVVRVERDEFGPAIAIGRSNRSGDHAEVLSGVVGADVEEAVAMVGGVVLRVERDEFGPAIAIGRSNRSGDHAEVLSGVVGADVEEAVAMVGVVLLLVKARGDELEFAGGLGGGEGGNLTCGLDRKST